MRTLRFILGLLGLIVANLLPLAGILFWGWHTAELLFCFWVESLVVGIFTMLKLSKYPEGAFFMMFFPLHYGIFMLVHLIFLIVGAAVNFFGVPLVTDPLALMAGVSVFFLGSMGSHALSYYTNFLQGREWERHSSFYYFILPYGRIVPMHIAIILGAIGGFGPFILYGIKLVLDIIGYCVEHVKPGTRSTLTPKLS